MKKAVAIFGLVVIFLCCSDAANKKVIQSKDYNKVFKITLATGFETDGYIHMYYITKENTVFNEAQSVWLEVKSSPYEQKDTITLLKGIEPVQLRIDFIGNNPIKKFFIKKIKLEYKNKEVEFVGTEIFKYFRGDKTNTKVDIIGGALTPIANSRTVSLFPYQNVLTPILKSLNAKE